MVDFAYHIHTAVGNAMVAAKARRGGGRHGGADIKRSGRASDSSSCRSTASWWSRGTSCKTQVGGWQGRRWAAHSGPWHMGFRRRQAAMGQRARAAGRRAVCLNCCRRCRRRRCAPPLQRWSRSSSTPGLRMRACWPATATGWRPRRPRARGTRSCGSCARRCPRPSAAACCRPAVVPRCWRRCAPRARAAAAGARSWPSRRVGDGGGSTGACPAQPSPALLGQPACFMVMVHAPAAHPSHAPPPFPPCPS